MARDVRTEAGATPADVRIRLAVPADAGGVRAIYAPFVRSSAITFETAEPSVEEMARRIRGISSNYPWLVGEISDGIVGYAYASRHRERAAYRWSVEVSVYVDGAHQRQGIGSALYDSLLRILVDQNFFTACAGITLPNPASVAMHERKGFRPIGVFKGVGFKLGAWHDVGWWQLPLQEKKTDPGVPIDFPTWVKGRGGRALAEYGVRHAQTGF